MDETRLSTILRRGRLRGTNRTITRFISSSKDDFRIAKAIVQVNEAHVLALARAHVISRDDAKLLLKTLSRIEDKIPSRHDFEDVHVLIEEYIIKRLGARTGGQLHTGKSRNDQVVTAIRMVLRDNILHISRLILNAATRIGDIASKNTRTIFVGYTHLQPAQPITYGHYLISIQSTLIRDYERFTETFSQVNKSPMGAGALAGSSFPINRPYVARLLGFKGLIENSLDAVSSRDFLVQALACYALLASNISRIAQDLIFYSSMDVGLVTLPDEYTSTSSIIPQKKNPDPLELIRAKSASITGNLSTALTIIHSLPTGYNLDFQELTPLLWNSFDTSKTILEIISDLLPAAKIAKDINEKQQAGFTTSTEIANTLVRKEKIPFREAHQILGQAVRKLIMKKQPFTDLSGNDWSLLFERKLKRKTIESLDKIASPMEQISAYKTIGSPNPKQTMNMLNRTKKMLGKFSNTQETERKRLNNIARDFQSEIRNLSRTQSRS